MKDLLSKKHYCYIIHKSLKKSSGYSPLPQTTPSMWITPYSDKKILTLTFMIFQKSQPPVSKGGFTLCIMAVVIDLFLWKRLCHISYIILCNIM